MKAVLVAAVVALTLTGRARAVQREHPDGPAGTVTFDLYGDADLAGTTGPDDSRFEFPNDPRIGLRSNVVSGRFSVVAAPWLSVSTAIRYANSRVKGVYRVQDITTLSILGYVDSVAREASVSLSLRFCLNPPAKPVRER